MRKYGCFILFYMLVFSGFAVHYSDDYFGLSMEFQKTNFIDEFREKNFFDNNQIAFLFTYGPSFSGPLRFRIGGGVHELSQYYLSGGIEWRILEFLNSVKGRIFGLYLNADLKMGLDYVEAAVKGEIFIPFSVVGGLQFGIGLNHNGEPLFSIAYSGGVYPLITRK